MKILYVCPEVDVPVGGVKQIYRHVEALRSIGLDAYVLQNQPRPPTWFESIAPLAWPRPGGVFGSLRMGNGGAQGAWLNAPSPPTLTCTGTAGRANSSHVIAADDFLLLPEYLGVNLRPPAWPVRLGVFNQNAHYTFNFGDVATVRRHDRGIYAHARFVLCVSDHSREYLEHAFPGLPVLKTLNGVNTERFVPRPDRRRQIAYMPRKLAYDAVQLFHILQCRGRLEGWEVTAIDGMSEVEVAKALGRSRIFVSTCTAEGFGLPPLEAAAAGCSVVGYTGYAASEYMRTPLCNPVSQGDVLGLAKATESLMARHDAIGDAPMTPEAEEHMLFVGQHYSLACERASIVAAWAQILSASGDS